jgi:Calcium/calmodulin dependent protein kinase II association domain
VKLPPIIPIFGLGLSLLAGFTSPTVAQESRWGSPDEDTVKLITAAEAKWASSACGPQPDLKDVIAGDFQGTSTKGQRYGKEDAITTDTKSLSRDCQLGEVKVRFFGDSIAIAYGAENSMIKDKDGKETKRCQVWTDTWLKRAGKWQIVAAQDTVIPCNP